MENICIEKIATYFPIRLRGELALVMSRYRVDEIRVRVNRPIQLIFSDTDIVLSKLIINADECKQMFEAFCNHSVYAYEQDIKNGYITLSELGIRVGISGDVLEEDGRVIRFREVTGFCIRVPSERLFCSKLLCRWLNGLQNSSLLVISPPAVGKTTLLRDIARELSDCYKRNVCIVDERSELAGCYCGIPGFNVGLRTDVLDNCHKSNGMLIAIRTLSPNVIICDELGVESDYIAAQKAISSGVSVAASIHGAGIEQICYNEALLKLCETIRYYAILRKAGDKRMCSLYDKLLNKQYDIDLNQNGGNT